MTTAETYIKCDTGWLYWVEVSDENCAIQDSIIVNQYPKLDVTLGEDVNTCDEKTVTLTPTNHFTR